MIVIIIVVFGVRFRTIGLHFPVGRLPPPLVGFPCKLPSFLPSPCKLLTENDLLHVEASNHPGLPQLLVGVH
jgi:hypothetical protein